ncbi:hypothetical protein J3E73DRAFT_201429, partial [Bipolaris maydis]
LIIQLSGPNIVNAWLCNCYYVDNPLIKAAAHFCSGQALCYDAKLNYNSCILNHPITDEDCANSYGSGYKAECEHWTGPCPA